MGIKREKLSKQGSKTEDIQLTLNGSLTIYEAKEVFESFKKETSSVDSIKLVLTDIESCDTAGVQLICALVKEMQKQGKKITLSTFSASFIEASTAIGTNITTDLMTL